MKKIYFSIFFAVVFIAKSQTVPQGINYQAVVRNNTGVVLLGSTVNMKFELFNSAVGPVAYTEVHNGLSTGLVGVVTCSIGMGTTANNFSVDVNWPSGDVWYQAYIDIGSGMNAVGAKQKFMTVPYAFFANDVPVSKTGTVLTIGTKTVALNSAPNYSPGVGISIVGGVISNTSIAAVTPTISGAGSTTVTGVYPNLTISTPTLLPGGNGIYGGSGALTASITTVAIGTNTLVFANGAATSAVTDFLNNGPEAFINVIHGGSNATSIKFKSLGYGQYGTLRANAYGLSLNAASFLNTITTSTLGDVWLNASPSFTNEGRLVINHSASIAYPTIHLKAGIGSLNRIKFSDNGIANRFFEMASDVKNIDNTSAYSINFHDGVKYKNIFLVYGDRKVAVNPFEVPLSSFHVMTNSVTASVGITSEGFAQPGKISIARNNFSGGVGVRSPVSNSDTLGLLTFSGFNSSSNMVDGAAIRAIATQNYTGFNGTELLFSTTPNGFTGLKNVMTLTNDGKLVISNTLTIPNGSGLGKVLTSDAAGNASWQATSAGITGAGTQSVIPMWGAGNTLTNSPISVFAATGGVIIKPSTVGSGSPAVSLIVERPSGGSYVAHFLDNSNANTGIGISTQPLGGHSIGTLDAQDLGFFTSNTNVTANYPMVLKTSGRVGIGTVNPSALLHLAASSTVTTVLLIDDGHIKSTGAAVTTGSAQIVGGFVFTTPIINLNSTDVKGAFTFSLTGTSLAPSYYYDQVIIFSKPYSAIPVVLLSPLCDLQGLDYMISSVSTSSFSFRIYRTSNTLVTEPTSIIPASLFKFNYFVIE